MARNVERYFGILRVACVLVCAVLAAKAVNHWIEAEYLSSEQTSSPVRTPVVSQKTTPESPTKDGALLASRNMFCSECLPPEMDGAPPATGDEVPLTKLPIQLVATSLSEKDEESYATVRNVESGAQGAFWLGDRLPGGGPIDKIAGTYVHFTNPESNRIEKVSLLGEAKPRAVASARSSKASTNSYADNVRKVGDNSYEVERGMIDQLIANPGTVKGARMRPYQKDGKMKGFQMFAVRKDSLFTAIGLKSGDAITAINGYDLSSPDKVLEAYTKVKDLDKVALSVVRRGKEETFTYQAR